MYNIPNGLRSLTMDEQAQFDQLVWLPLLMARRFGRGIHLDDSYSDALVGLFEAVQRYDPDHEPRASLKTYAYRVIEGRMLDGMRFRAHTPRSVWSKANQRQAHEDELAQVECRNPREMRATLFRISLDEIRFRSDDTEFDLYTVIGYEDTGLRDVDEMVTARQAIRELGPFSRWFLEQHWFEGVSLQSLADRLGVTESRTCRMNTRLITCLRDWAMGDRKHLHDPFLRRTIPEEADHERKRRAWPERPVGETG